MVDFKLSDLPEAQRPPDLKRPRRRPSFADMAAGCADVRAVMRENAELRRVNASLRHEISRLEMEGAKR